VRIDGLNIPWLTLNHRETAAEENATAYFPLLDRIADGYFDTAQTDQALYTSFRKLLQEDRHLFQAEDLSSFDLALSMHSAAPRLEAHFQHYNTAVQPKFGHEDEEACESWVHVPWSGQRFCSPDLSESSAKPLGNAQAEVHTLPFDRVLGCTTCGKSSVLYADITSPSFREFHKTISKTAKDDLTSYRVRYKPSKNATPQPLLVSGYGVELALKRTDYIVIDDRKKDENTDEGSVKPEDATLSEEELSDLRPLSASEVRRLGIRAASFVLANDAPFDTLVKLSQDFPKHSSSIAATNISEAFLKEHHANRDVVLTPGFNALWINGVQIMGRDVDAYTLLEHLRRERKMINSVRDLGLSGPQAVELLSHEAITASQVDQEPQRYEWRDNLEGGNVIMWLNDIEKDKRYADWPTHTSAYLQRTYPGQLPNVRRDLHNLVIPIDFSDRADVLLVTEGLQSYVKRMVPIRFGLVPVGESEAAEQQARVVYHLLDTYGLAAVVHYLQQSVQGAGRKYSAPEEQYFTGAIEDRKIKRDRTALSLQDVTESTHLEMRISAAHAYTARLGASGDAPPIFINGMAIQKTEEWLQMMSQRVGMDLRTVQNAIYEQVVAEDEWLPSLFLVNPSFRRNPQVVPEDDKSVRHVNVGELPFEELPLAFSEDVTVSDDTPEPIHLTVAADLTSRDGLELLVETLQYQKEQANMHIAVLHVPSSQSAVSSKSIAAMSDNELVKVQSRYEAIAHTTYGEHELSFAQRQNIYGILHAEMSDGTETDVARWAPFAPIITAAGILPGQKALILNGRVVGPINGSIPINTDDLEALVAYERKQRLAPARAAINAVAPDNEAHTPTSFAKISNLIALSLVSDIPDGIFEAAPTIRTAIFDKWESSHTAIKVGDRDTATVQIVASIDPASELAQRWIPIIKALSELDGVYTCLYLNPKERIDELPIKRFYRYVLGSKPTFDSNGALQGLSAHFAGLPAEALLNMGMDLPPSWLVAPEESFYDLDNIKLSAVKGDADIGATYELEHILIEGHSRDATLGPPPRGAQLVLGTELDPHFADTIVMANLGYFQFKANPGVYNLALQKGRSEGIFHIDSAGTNGYDPAVHDESTEIALMSFRGATLFPRLSRKPGMEEEDVLEASKTAVENLADQADKLLGKAGVAGAQASKYLHKATKIGSSLLPGSSKNVGGHADINIFSVASGHLYERMLNIMMVSVMKHTKHTVKFWFIEQFLSPSFKTFLPALAAEYGFKYEMVTYKWPHWLRAQKEKQREIWGYKILFLDVLFPLDLDKVIFVDADQIVRTDMYSLVQHDLQGAPYGFTPMCDSRTEMEGFRFWKQGYWKSFLRGKPYHISALYVVDLKKFRQIAAGDRLRQQYHQLSADPASLSNLDQDLPNHMQAVLPIHSLPQEWLWCETWCSDAALKDAKTIDLCNNPQTKEPKLDRARRQVPEWTVYDDEIAAVARKHKEGQVAKGRPVAGDASDAGEQGREEESMQERLQREDAERERKKGHDEL
jgi:UDP-glucose:glycoprotein glucosyltransferase